MSSSSVPTPDVLRRAADLTRTSTWLKTQRYFRPGFVIQGGCAMGQLDVAFSELRGMPLEQVECCNHEVIYAMARAMGLDVERLARANTDGVIGAISNAVMGWNDNECQTRENVAATFELAAVLEEQRLKLAPPKAEEVACAGA